MYCQSWSNTGNPSPSGGYPSPSGGYPSPGGVLLIPVVVFLTRWCFTNPSGGSISEISKTVTCPFEYCQVKTVIPSFDFLTCLPGNVAIYRKCGYLPGMVAIYPEWWLPAS